jgi:phosphatidylinositol glycan class H protein
LLLILRIVLSLTTILLLHARWIQSPFAGSLDSYIAPPKSWLSEDTLWHIAIHIHRSRIGAVLGRASLAIPLAVLLPGAAILCYILSLRVYSSESLLVLRGLGVQTSESPKTYLTSAPTRFIPTEKIQDIFVNEAFRGFEVRYYLIVVVEGEEDVVVVFPGLLPKRSIVEMVWRGARECLYEKGDRSG